MKLFAFVILALLIAGCSEAASVQESHPATRETFLLDIYPEVWSSNGFDGQTFEYKVNCGPYYDTLNECFLYNLTNVTVETPSDKIIPLDKDFNVNNYSGETTRRWVIYGPAGAGLPAEGEYTFNYYNNELVYSEKVDYAPETVERPKAVIYQQTGNDLHVSWIPPATNTNMWYKVLIFPESKPLISQVFEWDAEEAVLEDVPLEAGDKGTLNVAVYFPGGYAYSEYYDIEWG